MALIVTAFKWVAQSFLAQTTDRLLSPAAAFAAQTVIQAWDRGKAFFYKNFRHQPIEHSRGDYEEVLEVSVSRNLSNIEEARRANLQEKSKIRHLVLSWKNNEDERGHRDYNDEVVMKELEAHPNLKELTVEGFMGKSLSSWVTKMTSLVKITLKDCNRCEALPPLHRLERLEIKNCPNMRKIPDSCCRFLKEVIIGNLESTMILETISRISSLTTLKLGGGKSCRSNSSSSNSPDMESIINLLLENSSRSLNTLELIECKSVQQLTVGVALEKLWVYDCPKLTSIDLNEGSAGLKSLTIRKCSSSLLEGIFAQGQRSTLERLKLGPFMDKLDEFPWPFSSSSSSNSFPNLYLLEVYGWEKVKSIAFFEQLQVSTFPALKELYINEFKQVKALPDSISRLPVLQDLNISDCNNLESLPTFEESHSHLNLKIIGCPILKERCMKDSGAEWFKIKYIPNIKWV